MATSKILLHTPVAMSAVGEKSELLSAVVTSGFICKC